MNAKDVLKQVVDFSHMVARYYVDDLTDADLLVRSVPGSNHIAWQFGHMIGGTQQMLRELGHETPSLPEGFVDAHSPATSAVDDPAKFRSKAEYMELAEKMKSASLAAIDATPDGDLEKPAPEAMREYAPTVSAVLGILGTHWLMHVGQFVPIRRKLGKPPLF